MLTANQNTEQLPCDRIDLLLKALGWVVQAKSQLKLGAAKEVALRQYQTEVRPDNYIFSLNRIPVGIIETKLEEEEPLHFAYESTSEATHFSDYRDPKLRLESVFTVHRPETFSNWLLEGKTLRAVCLILFVTHLQVSEIARLKQLYTM